jgi:hypothetical protein
MCCRSAGYWYGKAATACGSEPVREMIEDFMLNKTDEAMKSAGEACIALGALLATAAAMTTPGISGRPDTIVTNLTNQDGKLRSLSVASSVVCKYLCYPLSKFLSSFIFIDSHYFFALTMDYFGNASFPSHGCGLSAFTFK